MTTEDMFREALEAIENARMRPFGIAADTDTQKQAGMALVKICGGDLDKGRTAWKIIVGELSYMPTCVCVALIRATSENLVPDVEHQETSF